MKNSSLLIIILPLIFFCVNIYSQNELPDIETIKLSNNLYKFHYGVNNWLVLIGPDGILLSDSAPEKYAEAMESEIKRLGGGKVRYIINTHWHHDHTGGNLLFGKGAKIIAHHSVRDHLLEKQVISLFDEKFKAFPEYACPDLLFTSGLKIYFNREEIDVIQLPGGHTAGDAIVYFKKANVLHIGDLYISRHFPAIDYEHGGDVEKLVENFQDIINMMPSDIRIVSGHLSDATIDDVKKYVEMLSSTLKIVKDEMEKGMPIVDMKKKSILKDWENWGKHVTTEMWIETIYQSLTDKNTREGEK